MATVVEALVKKLRRTIRARQLQLLGQVGKVARGVLGRALYYSGALECWRRRRKPRKTPLTLMYHSIGGGELSPDIVVSETHFNAHIRHLRRHYKLLSVEDAMDLLEKAQPIPDGSVLVTLDDGYRDNYDNALPVLVRHRCPATIFVTVEPVDTGLVPWSQALWRYLWSARIPEFQFSWRTEDGILTQKTLSLRTEVDRNEARVWIKMFAGRLGSEERQRLLRAVGKSLGCSAADDVVGERAMLNWDEVRAMHSSGCTIGSHTLTHPRLRELDGPTVLHELIESRKSLERQLHSEIRFFAYPFGGPHDFDENTRCAVEEAGYRAGFAAVMGERDADVDVRALERMYIPDEPGWKFALRMALVETDSNLISWVLR